MHAVHVHAVRMQGRPGAATVYVVTTVKGACVVLDEVHHEVHAWSLCSQEDLRKAEEIMRQRKEKAAEDATKAKAAAEAAEKEAAEKAEKEQGATAAVDAERKASQHVKAPSLSHGSLPRSPRALVRLHALRVCVYWLRRSQWQHRAHSKCCRQLVLTPLMWRLCTPRPRSTRRSPRRRRRSQPRRWPRRKSRRAD